MADDPDGDDLLFERLQQSASGDAAVRQLRRRYDLLRRDYEHLLDRLGEIEDRLPAAASTPAPREPEPEQTPPPRETRPEEGSTVSEGLIGPLLRLRDEYLSAVGGIQSIVTGLDGLAAAAFKGQHSAPIPTSQPSETRAPAPRREAGPHADHGEADDRRLQIDVKGPGFGALLEFRERLSKVAGVERVSIKTIDNERATLIVELTGHADHN